MRARAGREAAPPRRRAARRAGAAAAQGARAAARGRCAGLRRHGADARRPSGAVAALLRRPQLAGEGALRAPSRCERHLLQSLQGARATTSLVHLSEHPRGAWLARAARRALQRRAGDAAAAAGSGRRASRTFIRWSRGGRRHQVEAQPRRAAAHRRAARASRSARCSSCRARTPSGAIDELVGDVPFVHMHPASRWRFKCWPAEHNAELIDRLAADGHSVVLTSAPDEIGFIDEILEKDEVAARQPRRASSPSRSSARSPRGRRLFVGVDSMPMHLAAAMGTPTVALFGPSGENEWGPWNVERTRGDAPRIPAAPAATTAAAAARSPSA